MRPEGYSGSKEMVGSRKSCGEDFFRGKIMWREQRGLVLIEVILYSFVILSILDRIAFVNLFCYDFIIFLYLLLYCS